MSEKITKRNKNVFRAFFFALMFVLPFSIHAQDVTITVMSNPNYGTFDGGQFNNDYSIAVGEHLTIEAEPAEGYVFAAWTEMDDNYSSTSAELDLVVTEEMDGWIIIATFGLPRFILSANSIPEEIAYFTGVGEVESGSDGHPRYYYNEGYSDATYEFQGWSTSSDEDDIFDDANPVTISNVTGNMTIYAIFHYLPQNRTINVAANNNEYGTVNAASQMVDGTPTSGTSIQAGEGKAVTLTAVPGEGYEFVGWKINDGPSYVSTVSPYEFTLPEHSDATINYTAVFSSLANPLTFEVLATRNFASGGNVSPATTQNVVAGSNVTFSATINSGWAFDGWKDEQDNIVSTSQSYEIINLASNLTLEAQYRHLPWTVTAAANPEEGGSVNISGDLEEPNKYRHQSTVTLTEEPNEGWRFTGWSHGLGNNATATINNLNNNYEGIAANYVQTFTFAANANGHGTVSFEANTTPHDGRYDVNTTFTVTASPEANYEFAGWTVNGEPSEVTASEIELVLTDGDIEVVAKFAPKYRVTLNCNPLGIATLNGAGYYSNGAEVTVSYSNVQSGYSFSGWYIGTNKVGEEATYVFNITNDVTLSAVFTQENPSYTVTVLTEGNGHVEGENIDLSNGGVDEVAATTFITLTPVADEDYHFVKWVNMANQQEFNTNPYSFEVNSDVTLKAVFVPNTQVNVTFRMHPAGVGRVQECDQTTCEFAAGGSYTFHAEVLDETYEFWDWIVNGQMAGRKNNPILTLNNLTEDVTIDVWFSPLVDDGTIDYLIYGVADEQTGEIDSTIVLGVQEPYRTSVTSIVIPNTTLGVHTIAAHAFDGCTSLESIYIPASVDTVLAYAFANCPALTTIDLSEVDTIGASAFYGCTALREATLSDNLTVIQDELFYNCSALESITIPASVTSIGNSAFYGCSSLYEIEIPAAVETVGMQAFMGNSNLRIVTVNGGVQSFGEDCFRRSNAIAQTNFNGEFAQWFDIDFENASANPAAHSRNLVVNGEHINKVVVPEGVEAINAYAFYNNTRIDTLVLSADVETIGEEAFFGVANLKRIVIEGIPNEIEVSDNAFDNINKNNVVVEVPCAYIDLTEWHGFTRIIGAGMPVLTLMQRPGGIAKFDETDGIPECGSNPYTYHVIAQASSSYNFVGWSDGFTAPSRYVTLTEDASLAPIFRRKDNVDAVNTKNYDFELPNDPQDWFNIASGDNDWTVGTAVSYLNNHSLYVSKDNGQSCSYNVSNSPYTFTEFKLHSGLYRFSFNYSIGNDIPTNDNLSVAIIPIADNESDEAYANINPYEEENMPLFIENLTSTEGEWEDAFRLIEIPGEADASQWYRLVFFWNVVSEDNEMVEEIPAVAVDNITLEWMSPKPNQLKKLTATVYVETDDDPEEDMSEQYFVYTWTDQEWIMNRYNNNGDVIRTWEFTEEQALPSPNFEFHYGEHIMIHARVIDNEHYRFVSWNDGNTNPDREISFLDIYGIDPTFIAHFEAIPEHLTLSVAMEQGAEQKGTPAIRNSYEIEIAEQPVTVYAFVSETAIDPEVEQYTLVLNEPQAEWAFMGWANENGDTLSTENPFTLQYGQTTFGNVENALDWGRNVTIFALMNQLPECPNSDFDFTNPNFFGRYDFRGRDIDDNDVVSNVEISTRNGQIIVSEANGVEVSLYDVNGRLLETKVDNAQTIYFEVPVTGSYMLKIGDLMIKKIVVVR